MNLKQKCVVIDGRFVEPCEWLRDALVDARPASRTQGLRRIELRDTQTLAPTRAFILHFSKKYPNGYGVNFCPFCGAEINAPFRSEQDT
jgi:hypothetical protein